MAKKGQTTVRPPERTLAVDPLAELEGLSSAPAAPKMKEKKQTRPVEELLDAADIKLLNTFAAAHGVEAYAKTYMDGAKPGLRTVCRKLWAKIAFGSKHIPENPMVKGPDASVVFQVVGKYKIMVPEGQTVSEALVAAGLSKAKADAIAATVTTRKETVTVPLQELKANAETLPIYDKIIGFITGTSMHAALVEAGVPEGKAATIAAKYALTTVEKARVLKTTPIHEVGDFLKVAVQQCDDLVELEKASTVIGWEERLSPVKYTPGLTKALEFLEAITEEPETPASVTTTTTVKEVVKAA